EHSCSGYENKKSGRVRHAYPEQQRNDCGSPQINPVHRDRGTTPDQNNLQEHPWLGKKIKQIPTCSSYRSKAGQWYAIEREAEMPGDLSLGFDKPSLCGEPAHRFRSVYPNQYTDDQRNKTAKQLRASRMSPLPLPRL